MSVSISVSDLKGALGDEFAPGMEVSFDRCLPPRTVTMRPSPVSR